MTTNFPAFVQPVNKQFQRLMKADNVFVTDLLPDFLYGHYLAAFPAGTNPIFRTLAEHDCSCCKQFIRHVGNIIAVENGQVYTVWDEAAEVSPYPYNIVAQRMRGMVHPTPIFGLFRVGLNESSFGASQTRSLAGEEVHTWNHLYTGEIPRSLRVTSPDQVRGDYRTTVQVFERGLTELSPEAVETVLALVEDNSLYRGEEHKHALVQFQKAQRAFLQLEDRARELFVWTNADYGSVSSSGPVARFRNTVIGTLVQDLSEGRDLESAVQSFEAKVAPQNYKRTTALITPGMVKKAMETIENLGLEPALERRLAVMADIFVTDVKWVDDSVKPLMKGGIGGALMEHAEATTPVSAIRLIREAEFVTIDDFMDNVVPTMTGMEILFQGALQSNLMVLTTPVHPEPKQLFRWNNDFAWSYGGNVTDSIKERVKKAGGRVDDAVLRVSLSWFNYDDLDLHVYEPESYGHIYFANEHGRTGGVLDVDMNAGAGRTREPVENVVWTRAIPDGAYRIVVNNFNQRATCDVGFVIEVENNGKLSHFSYNKAVRNLQGIEVVTLHMKNSMVERVEVGEGIVDSNISQETWGLKTEQYVKVSAVTLSPNYWGENRTGNKHTFFILEGCKCDEPMRGIYNEFLHPRLEPHRKVFEVIGDKTKCLPIEGHIAGLGFSSTKPASFVARVRRGKKQQLFGVKVG